MDLTTDYLGLRLRNPLISGASPLCDDLNAAVRLQDAGAAAVVMRSLFEEQIEPGAPNIADPDEPEGALGYPLSPDEYLRQLGRLREQLADWTAEEFDAGLLDEVPEVVRAHFQLPSPEEADALA